MLTNTKTSTADLGCYFHRLINRFTVPNG